MSVRRLTRKELADLRAALDGLKVDILGSPYTVNVEAQCVKRRGLHGECDPGRMEITIDRAYPDPLEILIHESLHAAAIGIGVDMREADVLRMTQATVQILRANPIFARLWGDKPKEVSP